MNATLKSFLQFPVVTIIAGITVCMGTMILIKNYIAQPILYQLFDNKIAADTIKNCISFVVLLTSYYLFSKYYEHKKPVELATKNFPSISTANYSLKLFTLLLTAALVEDLLIRGLMVRILENWLGTYITLVVAMLFEIMHIFNPNSNLFSAFVDLEWGFTMAMLYVYTKRIWLPFFFHLGWNFAQPFYGSNLTGLDDMGTIIQSKFEGPVLITGGKVGIEGSIFTAIFLLIIGITFLYLSKKEGKIIKRKIAAFKTRRTLKK
jgi:membrane protease YdiL (CAAX protease family)